MNKPKRDFTGQTFGVMTAIRPENQNKQGAWRWVFRCPDGTERIALPYHVESGIINTCQDGRKHYKSERDRSVAQRINGIRRRAKKDNIPIDLTDDEITELIIRPCDYCGLSPDRPWVNGIDRIDSNEGYIPGNVVPCCRRCNLAKGAGAVEDFVKWAKRIVVRNG